MVAVGSAAALPPSAEIPLLYKSSVYPPIQLETPAFTADGQRWSTGRRRLSPT